MLVMNIWFQIKSHPLFHIFVYSVRLYQQFASTLYLFILKGEKDTIRVNPLLPNISIHVLHTIHYTFPKVLTRRICLTIKSFLSW